MEWTGARYADQPTVEATTWIDGDPERVWQVVADVRLMPSMSQELQSVEWCDGATGPALGHAFLGSSKHDALGEWQTKSFVIECDEPRVFAWAVQDAENPTATWRFTLAPENGGTRPAPACPSRSTGCRTRSRRSSSSGCASSRIR
jgi:uncharacterized protein YndB with AHSA1/START domain